MWLALVLLILVAIVATGWWWRYRSLACPAAASWLVDNPAMNAIAGPERLFQRMELKEGMRLLDVGCGPGRLTIPAAERVGPDGVVTALDIQEKMLEKLRRRIRQRQLHNVHPVLGGAGCGLVEKGYYDRVLLVTVLGEIRHKEAALEEIFEALKPGGILSVTEIIFDPHYTSRNKLSHLCEAAGFREVQTFRSITAYTRHYIRPARV